MEQRSESVCILVVCARVCMCACVCVFVDIHPSSRFRQLGVMAVKSDSTAGVMVDGSTPELFPAKCDLLGARKIMVGRPDCILRS